MFALSFPSKSFLALLISILIGITLGVPGGGQIGLKYSYGAQVCYANLDDDTDVDISDLEIFTAHFGRSDCAAGADCTGDLNNDGDVDSSDLSRLAKEYGQIDCFPLNLPSDPADVASEIDQTVATTLFDATHFLYTGEDPIQRGMAPDTIEANRAAVLRGQVFDRDDMPLSGVIISTLDHPEYGITLSREDGMFDMAVNGGGLITACYTKLGYLPAQRRIDVPWEDFVRLPKVVMIRQDTKSTRIDLSTPGMQVAQGSGMTDEDGARQATILFPQGIQAERVMSDGSTQPISKLNVHLTEYTIGDSGPQTMPAELPPNTEYTYAVELSADESVTKVNGQEIIFDHPIIFYVENFLEFPVGISVPLGYYDNDRGSWIPGDNGRVIQILSITRAMADLDVDGDGSVDTGTPLSDLGITDIEREKLASLYSAGQSLWRMNLRHLSTWDANWGWGPPEGAGYPNQSPPKSGDPENQPCEGDASIIEIQNQILGERLPLVGTNFTLNYRSDRVPGRKANYALEIPLSGDSLPASLLEIYLEIQLAGRKFTETFLPQPNLSHTFTWDGIDAYGRRLQGRQPITVRIGYAYQGVYQQTTRFGYNGGGMIEGNPTRQQVILWQEWQGLIGPYDARANGLGGWSLDVHHVYDPKARMLYLGDGRRQSSGNIESVIRTVAGNGERWGIGDGGPATEAIVGEPWGVAVGSDGSFYIADTWTHRIRRVDPDGIITTVAGKDNPGWGGGFSGDDGLAINAQLNEPRDVAVAPDGSIYIADTNNHRIRRVRPDGIITTVAGGGNQPEPFGDGGPATEARLGNPQSVALGPDGSLYIADPSHRRVRHVATDGIITTVAGDGTILFSGDGGLATEAGIDPQWVALGPDGRIYISGHYRIRRVGPDGIIATVAGGGDPPDGLGDGGPALEAKLNYPLGITMAPDGGIYIADAYNRRIRHVGPDGIITTVAGDGTFGFSGDNGPATQAQLSVVYGIANGPEGNLYLADYWNRRVRTLISPFPRSSFADVFIPSEDGSELYHFDPKGRHLRTLHALTAAVLYEFRYDAAGRLIAVENGDENVTTIERDAAGNPSAIVSPYGQRTTLSLDSNGFLRTVENPAGEENEFTYTDDGLMRTRTDPRNYTYTYTYDDDGMGRLVKAEDPAGGFKTFSRVELEQTETVRSGYEVTQATAMGRTHTYRVERLNTGVKRLVNTTGCCGQTEGLIGTNGGRTLTFADGTVVREEPGPDPRWGMLAPLVKSSTVSTPGGLQSITERTRAVTLVDPDDLLSLETLTDTVTLNGRSFTSIYAAGQSQTTTTSPLGRQTFTHIDAQGRLLSARIAGLPYTFQSSYDQQGRLATAAQGPGDDPTVDRLYELDYNAQGFVETFTDPLFQSVTFEYDSAGRAIVQSFSDGRQITFAFDPNENMGSITPPGRPPHALSYTPVNLLDVYAPPSLPDVTNPSTAYEYNLDRDLERVTRPDGLSIDLVYDFTKGRLERQTLPGGRQIVFDYYDGDPSGEANTGMVNEIRILPEDISISFTYDGFLIAEESWGGVVHGAIGRTYDNNLRIRSLHINSADFFQTDFGYDDDNLLSRAGANMPAVPLAVDFSIVQDSDNGLVTGTTLGGITTAQTYNGFGELAAYTASSDGDVIFEAVYDTVGKPRDKQGRITDLSETVEEVTTNYQYGYDEANHISNVWKNGNHVSHYSYDQNGNRTSHTNPSSGTGINPAEVEHDDQDRLLRYGDTTYTYTGNGELLTKNENGQTTHYEYGVLGNLRSVRRSDGTVIDYVIDGLNRRIGRRVNSVLVQGLLYEDELNPIAELDGYNNVVSAFVYANRANVPDYMVSKKEDGVTWRIYRIISDHLNSPRLVVNRTTGQVVQRLDYDEFGNILNDTNPGFQPFGFAGGLYDPDTQLTRFGARDYDAFTGRWTAKDPAPLYDGTSFYSYVSNDPINFVDETGAKRKGSGKRKRPYKPKRRPRRCKPPVYSCEVKCVARPGCPAPDPLQPLRLVPLDPGAQTLQEWRDLFSPGCKKPPVVRCKLVCKLK